MQNLTNISKSWLGIVFVFVVSTILFVNYKITVDGINYYRESEILNSKTTLYIISNYILEAINNIRLQLLTLSKFPHFKSISKLVLYQAIIYKYLDNKLLQALDPTKNIVQTRLNAISFLSDISLYSAYIFSGIRRILYEARILKYVEFYVNEIEKYINDNFLYIFDKNYLFYNFDKKLDSYLRYYHAPIRYLKNYLNSLIKSLDSLLNLSADKISSNINEIEHMLLNFINEHKLFLSVGLYDLFSNKICDVTRYNGIRIPISWALNEVVKNNKIFISGPVLFSEPLGQPFWNFAVTIRGFERQPQAYFVASINLAFINDLIRKIYEISQDLKVFVIDENGVVIAHFPKNLVTKQVNISYLVPEIKELLKGKSIYKEKKIGKTKYYIAAENLQNYDMKFMPNWGIIVMKPVESFIVHKISLVFTNIWISLILIFIFYYFFRIFYK